MNNWIKFHRELMGFSLYKKGLKIYKWEAYINGYKNAHDIMNGRTDLKVMKNDNYDHVFNK